MLKSKSMEGQRSAIYGKKEKIETAQKKKDTLATKIGLDTPKKVNKIRILVNPNHTQANRFLSGRLAMVINSKEYNSVIRKNVTNVADLQ